MGLRHRPVIRVQDVIDPRLLRQMAMGRGVLQSVGLHFQAHIREEIYRSEWKGGPRAAHSMARSIHFSYDEASASVTLYSTKSHLEYHDEGVKPQQMLWLLNARRPIPLRIGGGTVIFRWATRASMRRGSWWHPGIPAKNFVARGVDSAARAAREALRRRASGGI